MIGSLAPRFGAAALALWLPAIAALAQSAGDTAIPRRESALLSEATEHLRNDYVQPVDEAALASGCTDKAGTAAEAGKAAPVRSARDLSSVSTYLVELKGAADADVDYRKLVFACIEGMVGKLDKHSQFLPPEKFRELQIGPDPRNPAGIGIVLKGGGSEPVLVVGAIEDSPAWQAGIRRGEQRMLAIDSAPLDGKTLPEVVQLLRGKIGTPVTLTLETAGARRDLTLTRQLIRYPPARLAWLDTGVLHIRVSQFHSGARNGMLRLLEKFTDGWRRFPDALVFDLRDNQGGVLRDALELAGAFLADGTLVGYTRGRGRNSNAEYKVNSADPANRFLPPVSSAFARALREVPMVVLVNARTASGAEMVAAGLQANGRAALLGVPTLGFGSIQILLPMGDTALKLTHAYWYTPKHAQIEGQPLVPDLRVEAASAPPDPEAVASDEALAQALRYLAGKRGQP